MNVFIQRGKGKRAGGKLKGKTTIREYVTVTAQSPDLPPRPPFENTQVFKNGAINLNRVLGLAAF